MNYRFLFALFAVATPLVAGSYEPLNNYGPSSNGFDDLVDAATGGNAQSRNSLTANAEVAPNAIESARLSRVENQLSTLNANPTYNSVRNSDTIAEQLAASNLASNIRQGTVNVVSPNIVDQDVHRQLLVPQGPNNHQVIATQPLPPIIVNQPGAPPAQVSSGPAAVVKAAPVIYKIKPSVIFQQEVINKIPPPISLNPVYVKVYKPGKKVEAPVAPVVQNTYKNNYAPSSYGSDNAGSDGAYGAQTAYAAPAQNAYAPASIIASQPGYAQQGSSY